MAERVVLHIGTMKSGTTYLQAALMDGARELEAAGAHYVAGSFKAQTGAASGMLGPADRQDPRAWQGLVDELSRRDDVAIFSQEFLSFARPDNVDAIVRSFGGTEVEVVLTVRDQHRAIPAQWQSYTRNLGTDDWATYLRRLDPLLDGAARGRRSMALRKFRRAQDVPKILRRWRAHPGVSRVAVVTVPPGGAEPTELWRRFCTAARLDVAPPAAASDPANESLGYPSCDVLRRLNAHLNALPKPPYRRMRSEVVDALLPLRPEEDRPVLDRAGAALAGALNARVRDAVAEHGDRVEVVGSLDELPDAAPPESVPESVPEPDPAHVRRAAARAWQECLGDATPPDDLDTLVAELGGALVARGRRKGATP